MATNNNNNNNNNNNTLGLRSGGARYSCGLVTGGADRFFCGFLSSSRPVTFSTSRLTVRNEYFPFDQKNIYRPVHMYIINY
jgi:hypothetical protein